MNADAASSQSPSAWSSEKDLATQKKVWDEMVLEWVKLAPEVAKVTEA